MTSIIKVKYKQLFSSLGRKKVFSTALLPSPIDDAGLTWCSLQIKNKMDLKRKLKLNPIKFQKEFIYP